MKKVIIKYKGGTALKYSDIRKIWMNECGELWCKKNWERKAYKLGMIGSEIIGFNCE